MAPIDYTLIHGHVQPEERYTAMDRTRTNSSGQKVTPAVMVHGGAYAIPDELASKLQAGVQRAARGSHQLLMRGATAMDVVEAAVRMLEDDPLFDAGTGSVLNSAGEIEMDAMVMDGRSLQAGSVACVQNLQHPVTLARMVMEKSEYTMIVGKGANKFAEDNGMEEVPPEELLTEAALRELNHMKRFRHSISELYLQGEHIFKDLVGHDTVGAVALDSRGNVACATSTGGISAKHPGRVGDSPLVGCGGYADNRGGAVSATGHGEALTRACLSSNVNNLIKLGKSPKEAAKLALGEMQKRTGGAGGCIVVSNTGEMAQHFTTRRMVWASAKEDELHSGVNPGQDDVAPLT